MQYVERFDSEWQACFAINLCANAAKQPMAFTNQAFADWLERNEDLL